MDATKCMPTNAAAKAHPRFCGGIFWHPFFDSLSWGVLVKSVHISLEVLQKSKITLPRSMGVTKKCDSHGAWE